MSNNPRYANGAKRSEIRRWLLATQDHCGICGQPIDKSLKTPHPMSAEVDEIIPISKGGSPIDKENVRLVHRCCNQRRGNKMDDEIKVLNLPLPKSREW